jgi:glucose 1-dehydrogenase
LFWLLPVLPLIFSIFIQNIRISLFKNHIHMEKKLTGQVAIITGASSGIGAGVAKALSASGAVVVINYPVAAALPAAEAVLAEIGAAGGTGITAMCDVSKEAEVQKMFADTIQQYGTVDILINNAGLQKDSPFENMTLDQWNFVLGVNLTGQFLCAREAIREYLRRGVDHNRSSAAGKIIHMSSVHEVIPWAGHANYAASKGGIMLLMKTLAQEFAHKKIRINSICPGAIQTPINRSAWDTPEALEKLMTLIPYKRIGVAADIGKAAVWLCSDDSDYVNGTSLFVDGGMTLYPGFTENG